MERAERVDRMGTDPDCPRTDIARTEIPPRGPRTLRTLRAYAFGTAGLLLAGCASMPDHGEIRPVQATQGVDSQVRVFGVPPAPGPARRRSSTASWRP